MPTKPFTKIDSEIRELGEKIKGLRREKKQIEDFFRSLENFNLFFHDFPNFEYKIFDDGTLEIYAGIGGEKYCNAVGVEPIGESQQFRYIPCIVDNTGETTLSLLVTQETFFFAFVLPSGEHLDEMFACDCFSPYASGTSDVYVLLDWKNDIREKLPEISDEFLVYIEDTLRQLNIDDLKSGEVK